jgi:adenylate cyclase
MFGLLTRGQGRPLALVLALLMAACHVWLGDAAWQAARHAVFDAYQRTFPRVVEQLPAIIVAIDDASLAALGQWPWPRTRLARLVEATRQLGALVVGIDMIMPEADRLSPEVFSATG